MGMRFSHHLRLGALRRHKRKDGVERRVQCWLLHKVLWGTDAHKWVERSAVSWDDCQGCRMSNSNLEFILLFIVLSLLVLSTAAGTLYSHLYVPEALGEDTPVMGIARWLNAGGHCTKSRSPRHTDGWPGLSKAPPDTRNTEQHACPREAEPALSRCMDRLEGHVKQHHCSLCICHHTYVGRKEIRAHLSSFHHTDKWQQDRNTNDP